ncbi:hypothetical protein SLS60_002528 [Paraconiothyrium brasiliense]|uniref:MFS transporter n=1 Tax=Paraconiothyrium brasiliense TaxID=300254 RepID=A0ABR3S3P9_9PLEO
MVEKLANLDIFGIVLILCAVLCYLLALQRAGITYNWRSPIVIGLLCASVIFFLIFAALQSWLGERAMLVSRLLKDRTIWAGMIFIFFLAASSWIFVFYMPIYFQTIDGVSAGNSGVRTIPTVLSMTIGTVIAGGVISAVGQHIPLMILSGVLNTVGSGLLYTLDIGTGHAKWIGYQTLAGIGFGLGIQIPTIAAQALMPPEDISSATGMILFAQTLGGSLAISAAQSILTNTMVKSLAINAPSVTPIKVIFTGATDLQSTFTADELPGILRAYMDGLKNAFILAIAMGAMTLAAAFLNKWHDLKAINAAKELAEDNSTKTSKEGSGQLPA